MRERGRWREGGQQNPLHALFCALSSSMHPLPTSPSNHRLNPAAQFDKEVGRCIKLMEELEAVIARKKDVSQQVQRDPHIHVCVRACVRACRHSVDVLRVGMRVGIRWTSTVGGREGIHTHTHTTIHRGASSYLTSSRLAYFLCYQVKDGRQAISTNERTLAEISSTGATLKRHMATLEDKFQRLEHQVRAVNPGAPGDG
jgi:hypothetical protein